MFIDSVNERGMQDKHVQTKYKYINVFSFRFRCIFVIEEYVKM